MKPKFFILTTVPKSLNFFRGQINALKKYYTVTLISSHKEKLRAIAHREDVSFKTINLKREISIGGDLKNLNKLYGYFKKEKPAVIHCNTPKAAFLGLLAGRISGVPHRIYYIHGLRYEGITGFKHKLLIYTEKVACWCATDIIAVSRGIRKTAQTKLTSKKINLIHYGSANGIDLGKFEPSKYNSSIIRDKLGYSHSNFVFGYVGRLVGDKGVNELVDAFTKINERHSHSRLILIGAPENNLDPLKRSTIDQIKNNPAIFAPGHQKGIDKYLSAMNLFISPSYREGFGITLLEANLMGLPVIASNITGYNEIIKPGVNGFLITPKNTDELIAKMEWAIHHKTDLQNMAQDCIELIRQHYNHKDVLQASLSYYQRFLDKI